MTNNNDHTLYLVKSVYRKFSNNTKESYCLILSKVFSPDGNVHLLPYEGSFLEFGKESILYIMKTKAYGDYLTQLEEVQNEYCKPLDSYFLIVLPKDKEEFKKINGDYTCTKDNKRYGNVTKDFLQEYSVKLQGIESIENTDAISLTQIQDFFARDTNTLDTFCSGKSEHLKKAIQDFLSLHGQGASPAPAQQQEETAAPFQNPHEDAEELAPFGEIAATPKTRDSKEEIHKVIDVIQKGMAQENRHDAINYLLCTSLGFLTILAGEPGAGKTSTINYLAKALQLHSDDAAKNRFVMVAVEKGWTARQDFIGYSNPLNNGEFVPTNVQLYELLQQLHRKNEVKPSWVLLDEANLSQMEYYWADFMALCDLDLEQRNICIGAAQDEAQIGNIGNTLRFLATINLDRTTEMLSPRLIDRAWILYLPPREFSLASFAGKDAAPQESQTFALTQDTVDAVHHLAKWDTTFEGEEREVWWATCQKFEEIHDLFKTQTITFSPRTLGMIKQYCLAAIPLMDSMTNSFCALDYAVAQKILPLIDGYGQEYKDFLKELKKLLAQLPRSSALLKNIMNKGAKNMDYYHFFAR